MWQRTLSILMLATTLPLACGDNSFDAVLAAQLAHATDVKTDSKVVTQPRGIAISAAIPNHADASAANSLAAVLQAHQGTATYILLTDQSEGAYVISDTLVLPAGATLRAAAGKKALIKASAVFLQKTDALAVTPGAMLELKGGNKLIDVVVDAGRHAQAGVYGKGIANVELRGVTVQNTRNDYPNDTDLKQGVRRPYLVSFENSKNIKILGSEFRNAGANPKRNPNSWAGIGTGVRVRGIEGLQVLDNIIEHTLGAGIDFTGSTQVTIKNNRINYTGQNANYSDHMAKADAIAGYHASLGSTGQQPYHPIWQPRHSCQWARHSNYRQFDRSIARPRHLHWRLARQ
jgi:hypothetical protein